MPANKKQRLLMWAGGAGFFLFCFTLFCYLTFPYERVRDLLVSKVQADGAAGTKLSIGDLGPSWLTGVALTSITLERPSDTPDEPSTKLQADELKLRVSPWSLLFGGVGVKFSVSAGEGDVNGSYHADKDGPQHVVATLDALDLGRIGVGSTIGIPLFGIASGTIDVTLSDKPAETQGNIDLRIEHVKVGDAKGAKIKVPGMNGPLTLDAIDAGTVELKVSIKDGVAMVERLNADGKDLELSGTGSIRVAREPIQSRADLTLSAKFAAAYRQKSDRTKTMFDLLTMQHMVGPDGGLRMKVTGPLNMLRGVPAAAPATALPRAGTRSKH